MRRCAFCGRTEGVMVAHNWRFWRCDNRPECRQRANIVGKWIGTRILRRDDLDGTHWEIQPRPRGVLLTMAYREHKLTSQHADIDTAKAHVEDYLASLRARSMADYARGQR